MAISVAIQERVGDGESSREAVLAAARRLVEELPPRTTSVREFLGATFDAGLAWVHFPPGYGGRGADAGLQVGVEEILRGAGSVDVFQLNPMGYGMAGPTLAAHGSDELCRQLLRPLYTCEDIWCQLFSEPGAGSDLACHPGGTRRGLLGRHRPEGLDQPGSRRPPGSAASAHRPARAQAQGIDLLRARHARAGRAGAAVAPAERRG
jgi:Acyl-CoA dehydrogenase, N-terminal domain